jgi:hypothetical protein
VTRISARRSNDTRILKPSPFRSRQRFWKRKIPERS